MQVNTVWAAHEMNHQNGGIMQMQFATLQSLCFFLYQGCVCFQCGVTWIQTDHRIESLWWSKVSFYSHLWTTLYCISVSICSSISSIFIWTLFFLFLSLLLHFVWQHVWGIMSSIFCVYLFLFVIQFSSVYTTVMKDQVQQLHRNTTFITKPFLFPTTSGLIKNRLKHNHFL